MTAADRTIHGITHSSVGFAMPAGACDCHTHVFGPVSRFPYWEGRGYTPPDATIADLKRLHAILGLDRVVIVHPSPYGTDNTCSLDATAAIGLERARCVAVIDEHFTRVQLERLHADGVRGVRLNLTSTGMNDPVKAWPKFESIGRLVADLGWHIQTYTTLAVIEALGERFATLPVPLVVDHFGGLDASQGFTQQGWATLLGLVQSGKAYVKLSGGYRVTRQHDWSDVAPFARALIAANSERCVWGTDWPHPGGAPRTGVSRMEQEPYQAIDDGFALNQLGRWAPDTATRQAILVDNPARLYDFS